MSGYTSHIGTLLVAPQKTSNATALVRFRPVITNFGSLIVVVPYDCVQPKFIENKIFLLFVLFFYFFVLKPLKPNNKTF